MADSDLIVTMRDARRALMCSRGCRAFCKKHGLDWMRFLTEGLPAEQILATDDAMAKQLVEVARGRE